MKMTRGVKRQEAEMLFRDGFSQREISQVLEVSSHTVSVWQKAWMLDKLRAENELLKTENASLRQQLRGKDATPQTD